MTHSYASYGCDYHLRASLPLNQGWVHNGSNFTFRRLQGRTVNVRARVCLRLHVRFSS